jgi:hypothetical protein
MHQHLLCVPVRDAACGLTLRMFRDRDGSRCAAAFTSETRLTAVLGGGQRWIALSEAALRELTEPLGVRSLIVDPNLIAPPVRTTPAATAAPAVQVPTAQAASVQVPAAQAPADVHRVARGPHRQPTFGEQQREQRVAAGLPAR